jgi:hypothetical protein
MRVVQTHSKRVVLGILLSTLIVGVMLTIGQVPLAVSQPVTIPAKTIKGAIPMDGANPVWESVPGVIVPLSGQLITTPMHPNISVKSVFVKAMTNGKDIGLRIEWSDQTKNDVSGQHGWSTTLSVYGSVRRHHQHLAVERRVAEGHRQG